MIFIHLLSIWWLPALFSALSWVLWPQMNNAPSWQLLCDTHVASSVTMLCDGDYSSGNNGRRGDIPEYQRWGWESQGWGLGKSHKGSDSQMSLNNWRELYQEDQGRKGIPGRRPCTLRDTVRSSGGRSKGWKKGYGRKEAEDIRGQSTWGLVSHDEGVTCCLQQARVMEEFFSKSMVRLHFFVGMAMSMAVRWEGLVFYQCQVIGLETRSADNGRVMKPAWQRDERVCVGF